MDSGMHAGGLNGATPVLDNDILYQITHIMKMQTAMMTNVRIIYQNDSSLNYSILRGILLLFLPPQ